MASAWGKSWGLAFGAAWGLVAAVPPVGDAAGGIAGQPTQHRAPTQHSAFEERAVAQRQDGATPDRAHPQPEKSANESKAPLSPVFVDRNATNLVAKQAQTEKPAPVVRAATPPPTQEASTHGSETAQTVQAAQEGSQGASAAQQQALLRRQADELALIMILLEAVA